jgi:hypothetical protein
MIKIPVYAKREAEQWLKIRDTLPKSKQFGIDKSEASKLGINSGVERAKQIIKESHLPMKDAKRVAAFYDRFKNCTTFKCEGAIGIWGGRKFGKKLSRML